MTKFVDVQAAAWSQIAEQFAANETPNGPGSRMANTGPVREWLPRIIAKYGITSMLDAPCGDGNWMSTVDLGGVRYLGYDVEPTILATAQKRRPTGEFRNVNLLTTRRLPNVDLMWCRDFTLHLPAEYVVKLLNKIRSSNIRYLAVTNHPHGDNFAELPEGGHDNRPGYWCHGYDLEAEPFNLTGRVDSVIEAQDGTTAKVVQEMVLFTL